MSAQERDRSAMVRRVATGELTQVRAAELLAITSRHMGRLVGAWRERGDRGLVSGRRGKRSNNRRSEGEVRLIELALRERYADFGPTLAAEKLLEHEGLRVSVEAVRQIQVRLGLWRPKARKAKRVFQIRERRARFGELIQIDGSHHDWFEGRAAKCALLVFIDDASGRLTGLHFAPSETARGYLEVLRSHVLAHGAPLALYSDRHGIFRINAKDVDKGDGLTTFTRVTERLKIGQICASTPQAKGRVERANKTLQDRLVREMRLAGIDNMAAARAFLPGFMARYNAKFAVAPCAGTSGRLARNAQRDAADAHRPWDKDVAALDAALATHDERTLSKALTFSSGNAIHCVKTRGAGIALRGAKVVVRHYLDGRMDVVYKDRLLDCDATRVRGLPHVAGIADEKTLDARVDALIERQVLAA